MKAAAEPVRRERAASCIVGDTRDTDTNISDEREEQQQSEARAGQGSKSEVGVSNRLKEEDRGKVHYARNSTVRTNGTS